MTVLRNKYMNKYALYDFTESLEKVGLKKEDVVKVAFAWGGPEEWDGWEGGFIILLKNHNLAYLSGWCDYSGWGCQDGATLVIKSDKGHLVNLDNFDKRAKDLFEIDKNVQLDKDPIDLNNWLNSIEK